MSLHFKSALAYCGLLLVCLPVLAEDAAGPKPIPVTRPEVKAALDALKRRQPRLPLPPPTDEEKERASANPRGFGLVNNGRMRSLYLPESLRPARTSGGTQGRRERSPEENAQYQFDTELFWIVSRVNNCHYCLGHQEGKLLSSGLAEDRIAALDGDWSAFTEAERAAFAFTRKLTYEPHKIGDQDIEALRKHYSTDKIMEILFLVSRYNSTNRWTDSLGIPQEEHRELKTPTTEKYQKYVSTVAAFDAKKQTAGSAPAVLADLGPLPTVSEVRTILHAAKSRKSRLPVADEEATKAALSDDLAKDLAGGKLPNYVRLAASLPKSGMSWAATHRTSEQKGNIAPLLKAQIAFVAARQDRAWYALDHALSRLKMQGVSAEEAFALDAPSDKPPAGDRAALALAAKLTSAPQTITDADIEAVRKHFKDAEVAEIVYHITVAASFDRVTEAAALPLD